jgi:hypothetical protein
MGEDDRKRAVDALAWALNIFASVSIVMVNKQLMGSDGFGFSFGACAQPPYASKDAGFRAASF